MHGIIDGSEVIQLSGFFVPPWAAVFSHVRNKGFAERYRGVLHANIQGYNLQLNRGKCVICKQRDSPKVEVCAIPSLSSLEIIPKEHFKRM